MRKTSPQIFRIYSVTPCISLHSFCRCFSAPPVRFFIFCYYPVLTTRTWVCRGVYRPSWLCKICSFTVRQGVTLGLRFIRKFTCPTCFSLIINTQPLTNSMIFSFLLTYTPQHVRGEGGFVHSSIPVAMPSKALVCDTLIRGIADSSPTGIMDVRLLCILCVV